MSLESDLEKSASRKDDYSGLLSLEGSKTASEKGKKTADRKMIKIEVIGSDNEGSLMKLLEYIQSNGNTGHSFEIIVDPEDERKESFFWDGDGSDYIKDIKKTDLEEKETEE